MGLKHLLVCDNCGLEVPVESITLGWIQARPVVGNDEVVRSIMSDLEDGKKPIDQGMFCGLNCLGAWSYSTANLRALDLPTTADGFVSTLDGPTEAELRALEEQFYGDVDDDEPGLD